MPTVRWYDTYDVYQGLSHMHYAYNGTMTCSAVVTMRTIVRLKHAMVPVTVRLHKSIMPCHAMHVQCRATLNIA